MALPLSLAAALVLVLVGCTAQTDPATNITATSATLNATVTIGSNDKGGDYWFEWSSNGGSTWTQGPHHQWGNQSCTYNGSGTEGNPVPISENVTGLTSNTRYIYRVGGKICDGPIVYGDTNWRSSGDSDPPYEYDDFTTQLNVAAPSVTTPSAGDVSPRRFQLQAQSASPLASASFEYRRADSEAWRTVPLANVYTGAGQQLQAWPTQLDQSGRTPLLTWDTWRTVGTEGTVQIRARFNNGSGGWVASNIVKVNLSRSISSVKTATAPIGPGTVDLITGNYSISSDDVSIEAPTTDLVATRTYLSRQANKNANGPLGPGWRMSLPVPSAASAYVGLNTGSVSGPRSGAAFSNDPNGSAFGWNSPGNAAAADGNWATMPAGQWVMPSQYLKATNFGFSIPSGAAIKGIKVDVLKFRQGDGLTTDQSVKIVKGGAIAGAEHGPMSGFTGGSTWSQDVAKYSSYGDEHDVWGTTWTHSEINASNFGVVFSANHISNNGQAFVDHIRITVYYSPPGSDGSVVLTQTDGTQAQFKRNADGSFKLESGLPKMTLTRVSGGDYVLDDNYGDKTTFSSPAGDGNFVPVKTEQPGSANQTTLKWELVSGTARITRVLAPPPAGVTCDAQLNPGCRALTFNYATSTTATGTAQSAWGDYAGRLKQINLVAYDPAQSAMRTLPVAQYSYDNTGRLRAEWDPRVSPALKATYTYDANGVLSQMTPPGLAPWTFQYTTTPDDPGLGRLKSMSRSTTGLATQTTTVAYGVPLSGGSAPYQMTPQDVATWGQLDAPTDATAIFPADQVPANPPSSFAPAFVHYMNAKGQLVNLAAPGGRLATIEHDANGQIIRELDPANRAQALQSSDPLTRSQQLDTEHLYSGDGLRLLQTLEPLHNVVLESGATVQARQKSVMSYDEGSPGGLTFNVVTTRVEGAYVPSTGAFTDQRVMAYGYDGDGWGVRQPTSTTVDPGGLNLTNFAAYDPATGLQTYEARPKIAQSGSGAYLTIFTYYSASGNGDCGGKPWLANLLCMRGPESQPSSNLPPIPTSSFGYNMLDQVITKIDTSGASSRTKNVSYDSAGRLTQSAVSGPGAPVSTVSVSYDAATGFPKNTSASIDGLIRTIVRGYDGYGRPSSYRDSDGVTTTASYDVLDRPVSVSDPKGSRTMSYNAVTGDLTSLNVSGIGQFSATYDASGRILTERLPNGVRATRSYDESGAPQSLLYENCSAACTGLLTFTQTKSIHDQVVAQVTSGPEGTREQSFAYDRAGRLTSAVDKSGNSCKLHAYGYDADSNRTDLYTDQVPLADGSCGMWHDLTLPEHHKSFSFDEADRLINPGYQYDAFGRTVSVPASDAGGTPFSATYYANDLARTITQGTTTTTFGLDPLLRVRLRSVSGSPDEIQHYADDSATPSWTETPSSGNWTRLISSISGTLGVEQKGNASGPTSAAFTLTDMQGSVVGRVNTAGAPQLQQTRQFDEFGVPTSGSANDRYGWLGGHRVSTETSTGVIAMGARLYMPTLGRFLQVDPVQGGSANAYDYVNQDPLNVLDLSGERPRRPNRATTQQHFWAKRGVKATGSFWIHSHVRWTYNPDTHRITNVKIQGYYSDITGALNVSYKKGPINVANQGHWDWKGNGAQSGYYIIIKADFEVCPASKLIPICTTFITLNLKITLHSDGTGGAKQWI